MIEHPGVGTDGQTAVYRIYDRQGSLLYVGMGNNPMNRWSSHAAQHVWWAEAASFRVEWFSTRAEAASVERVAIRDEDPKHNIHGRPGWGQYVYAGYMARLEANRNRLAERQDPAA
ncbi:GIY-YIG nuclease family protein [Streptomyces sp. DH12]|uniref:GIY-YIG nuclease family protein n=1 Tax=Streptomyces sp. DH12 TaxID=2857010 RepID=UPI001E56BE63|nr:GIY-YIG nuclease family protein [Streptomyces sp. DH12]